MMGARMLQTIGTHYILLIFVEMTNTVKIKGIKLFVCSFAASLCLPVFKLNIPNLSHFQKMPENTLALITCLSKISQTIKENNRSSPTGFSTPVPQTRNQLSTNKLNVQSV
jgi:hypothetical protein